MRPDGAFFSMDRQPYSVRIPEEETSTPTRLIGILLFTTLGFFIAAAMLSGRDRIVPLVVGGGIAVALAGFAAWFGFQARYGDATARPRGQFAYGRVFEGVIHSELKTIPTGVVHIRLFGWTPSDEGHRTFTLRCDVAPSAISRSSEGIEIPFRFEVPDGETARKSSDVRLVVRTSSWPLGWGATFLVA